jgi:uncharacterized protein (DUF1800 family)
MFAVRRGGLLSVLLGLCGLVSACGGGGAAGSPSPSSAASTANGGGVVNTIVNTATGAVTSIVGAISDAANTTIGAVTSTVEAVANAIGSMLPGGVAPEAPPVTSASPAAGTTPTTKAASEADAARLSTQATFGPTNSVIDRIVALGINGWLDEQFVSTGSSYTDLVTPITYGSCERIVGCMRRNFTREQVAMRFYANALAQQDQLRQRVALALSQLLVAPATNKNATAGLAAYQQILLDGAFGNYRDLLTKVTLSCHMGDYLNMSGSHRVAPSENFARELMQLFTVGPSLLNVDGTVVRDASGSSVPAYGPDDVRGVARALTGWLCPLIPGAETNLDLARDYSASMITVAARYDTATKTFLDTTVPAGATPEQSVAAVLDAVFNHPSTAPFVSRFLIQHLVTSNPSPSYVSRVAAVFANNGKNVRGDLKAVIRAILIDGDARGASKTGDNAGKVKEPVLLLTSVARAVGMTTDGYAFTARDVQLGQPVFQANSVFNFYPPDYPLPQSTALLSPSTKLLTSGTTVLRSNLVYDWTIGAATTRSEFAVNTAIENSRGSTIDWSGWEALAADTPAMIERIDLLLLNRTMTAAQKLALRAAADVITDGNPSLQARKRAQAMLYAVLSSPLFQVDR